MDFLSTFLDRGNETVFRPGENMWEPTAADRAYLAGFSVVIITGATSGIGLCLGQAMAGIRPDRRFLSVSRSHAPAFVSSLKHASLDLSKPDGVEAACTFLLTEILQEGSAGPILLINNSGFGAYGRFPEPGPERHEAMIGLNAIAPVLLTARLLPLLRQRAGAILNVASIVGFLPTPFLATYGATKAFLLHWSLALNEELRGDGIPVTTLCPGPTRTGFFDAAGFSAAAAMRGSQSAGAVAREALRGLARRRALVVTGTRNRLLFGLAQMLPRRLAARLSASALRRLRPPAES